MNKNKFLTILLIFALITNCITLYMLCKDKNLCAELHSSKGTSNVNWFEEDIPYRCAGCDSCFSTIDSLYRHHDNYYCTDKLLTRRYYRLKYNSEPYPEKIKFYRICFYRDIAIDVKAYSREDALHQAEKAISLDFYRHCKDVLIGIKDIDSLDYGKNSVGGKPYTDTEKRNILSIH